ncbi:MAG: HAD family hydrolase [Christensenellales bacterium]|jgi:phosphoserine phosphatase
MMLAIFDLCGTLFRCNTLFAFARWACRRSLRCWFADSAVAKIVDMFLPRLRFRRRLFLSSIRRFDDKELAYLSVIFCRDVLPKYARQSAFSLLVSLQEKGWMTVLVSAAPDFLVREVSRLYGFSEWRASTYQNGVLTHDLTGNKLAAIREFAPWDLLFCVTDNRSDLPLLRAADYRRIYCGKHKSWWIARFPKDEVFEK